MNILQIIENKKNGLPSSKEEIDFLVKGFVSGDILPEQMSAYLMAVCINGMTKAETFDLCNAMLYSGQVLTETGLRLCDKHSTGGVSDTTTLVVLPVLASLGTKMLKASGRGLGWTGGTADKLEVFEGINLDISKTKALNLVHNCGACIMTQSKDFAPADKKIYALRDITATTTSLPLIATSIMSKKLALGASVLVLDIKFGKGALMQNYADAKNLAKVMVEIGKTAGKTTVAVLSDMNEPLGYCIGDKLETQEAIDILSGKQKGKLFDLCVLLASLIFSLDKNIDQSLAKQKVQNAIADGSALLKFKEIIVAEGGKFEQIKLEGVKKFDIFANSNGYIQSIDPIALADIVRFNGGGRLKPQDKINHNVGIKTFVKVGDYVNTGDRLATLYLPRKNSLDIAQNAFVIGKKKTKPYVLVRDVIK